tara:strand:- start:408 stop:899 length:492 start_codon:yes stop_codon:yes gene_type:complete
MSNLLVQNIKHTNGTTAQTIDSGGRVNLPNLICYQANRSAGDVSNGNIYIGNNVVLNKGNGYNSSTGKFTCPINGIYKFHFNILSVSNQIQNDMSIFKNGTTTNDRLGRSRVDNGGNTNSFATASLSILSECVSGDEIFLQVTNGSFYGQDFAWTGFGGMLVG